jgi:imidazolonepropionase-like amidohydrolase
LADEERVMKQIQGLVVAATVATASLMAQTAEPPAEVVIKGVAIVDVEAGRLLPDRDIVVRGTRIERVTPSGGPLPRGKTVIDGRGTVAIPGLVDAPVRLAAFSPATLQHLLAAGITAAGDVGTDATQLTRWRQDLDAGRLYAPRLAEGCRPAAPTAAGPASRTSPTAPGAVHDDLAYLVSSGRTPAQALRAMTIERARALCLDGLGTVTAGAPADLVVLAGNPLDDIRHTRAIDAVIFRGEVFTQAHVSQLRRGTLPAPTPPR